MAGPEKWVLGQFDNMAGKFRLELQKRFNPRYVSKSKLSSRQRRLNANRRFGRGSGRPVNILAFPWAKSPWLHSVHRHAMRIFRRFHPLLEIYIVLLCVNSLQPYLGDFGGERPSLPDGLLVQINLIFGKLFSAAAQDQA